MTDKLKPGDYVFVQFGHDDSSIEKTDRYTSPDAYRANMVRFIAEVRAKHATPVLLTPVMRKAYCRIRMAYILTSFAKSPSHSK